MAIEALGTSGEDTPAIEALRDPESSSDMLLQLSALPSLPSSLWREVSRLTRGEEPASVRVAATAALARFGTRESIALLVELTDDEASAVGEQARRMLSIVTGQGSPGWAADQWSQWHESVRGISDRAWTQVILTAQTNRRLQDEARLLKLREQTLGLYRRLHVELDAGGRSALLAELLSDDRRWIQTLGFDLAGRDLSARTALGEDVARAAATRLRDPDAGTRAAAANLIARLVPPDAMLLFTEALRAETSPLAAEPMLLAIARWPNPDSVDATLAWLGREDAPVDAACTALWSLASQGYLENPTQSALALELLRTLSFSQIGASGLRTVVLLGGDEDRERVVQALAEAGNPVRGIAAEALTETPEGLGQLLKFRDDPRFFETIAQGVMRHDPTVHGFGIVATLPALDSERRERVLGEFARRMPPRDLGDAVIENKLPDPLAERLLSVLQTTETPNASGIAGGLIHLGRVRLAMSNAAGAYDAVAALDPNELEPELAQRLARLMLDLALASGDAEAAALVTGLNAEGWILALSQLPVSAAELRSRVSLALRDGKPGLFDEAQLAQLNAWARAPSAETPSSSSGSGDTNETGASDG